MRSLLLALTGLALLIPGRAISAGTDARLAPATIVSGTAGSNIPALQGTFGPPETFATHAQLQGYGFSFGPSDGAFGAIPSGNGTYTFYGAAGSSSACPGTANVKNGAFTFTGTLDQVTGGGGCKKLFSLGDGPAGWVFDSGYAGGGQVVPFAAGGQSGWLMPFHSEFQWSNPASSNGRCNGVSCFYGSLGLAVSTDNGKTFHVTGQIVQPSQPLSVYEGGGKNLGFGYGSMVVADANGQDLDNPPPDPANAYFYIFYSDTAGGTPGACGRGECLGVARALYADVVAAALSGDPDRVATVFRKYDAASPDPWTQPATSDTADESGTAGSFAPLWTDEPDTSGPPVIGSATVLYDGAFGVYLVAYGSMAGIKIRTSADLIHWSQPIGAPYLESGRTLYQPTLMGETGDPMVGGAAPRVYFTSFPGGAFPNWADTIFESLPLMLSPAANNGASP